MYLKNVQILNQQTYMLPYSPGAERQLGRLEPSTPWSVIEYLLLCYCCCPLINLLHYVTDFCAHSLKCLNWIKLGSVLNIFLSESDHLFIVRRLKCICWKILIPHFCCTQWSLSACRSKKNLWNFSIFFHKTFYIYFFRNTIL